MMRQRLLLLVVVVLAGGTSPRLGSAQLQSAPGKSWKVGSAGGTEFVQLTVTHAHSTQISGTISLRCDGIWQGTQLQQFSGSQTRVSHLVRFDCACDDGLRFSGWWWPGQTGGRADDRVAIYFRPVAILRQAQPTCHPERQYLAAEDETELVE